MARTLRVALSKQRSVPPKRRRRAAPGAISAALLLLFPGEIAVQDLGALISDEPALAARPYLHLIASPFGTINAPVFRLAAPLGTAIPLPLYGLAKFDPVAMTGSLARQARGGAAALSQFPEPDRTAKADLLIARPRAPMPPFPAIAHAELFPDVPTLAPLAFMRFCARYPDDCKARPTEFARAPVALTRAHLAELEDVNHFVNQSIRPQANLAGVVAEEWDVAPRNGDCNDYAVTKRHELLARGWPSRALLLTEVATSTGEHHLVLVVRTREDDLVLDNLNGTVRPVSQMGYRFVRAQQEENPKFWSATRLARADGFSMDAR